MEKLNNPSLPSIILDSDVLVSWITRETETKIGKELWMSPLKIITLIEKEMLAGWVSLTTLLEIRFLLRRKKRYPEEVIESFFKEFAEYFEIIIPDEGELLRSNQLQSKFTLDPFDAILLAIALTKANITLITRHKAFLSIASKFLESVTPEEFLKTTRAKI